MVRDGQPNYTTGKVTAEVISHLWTKWTQYWEMIRE